MSSRNTPSSLIEDFSFVRLFLLLFHGFSLLPTGLVFAALFPSFTLKRCSHLMGGKGLLPLSPEGGLPDGFPPSDWGSDWGGARLAGPALGEGVGAGCPAVPHTRTQGVGIHTADLLCPGVSFHFCGEPSAVCLGGMAAPASVRRAALWASLPLLPSTGSPEPRAPSSLKLCQPPSSLPRGFWPPLCPRERLSGTWGVGGAH